MADFDLDCALAVAQEHEGYLSGGRAEGLGAAVGPDFAFFELLFGHGNSLGGGQAETCFTSSFKNTVYAFTVSSTRGGPNKAKRFEWHFDTAGQCVVIRNEKDFVRRYLVGDLVELLRAGSRRPSARMNFLWRTTSRQWVRELSGRGWG